MKCNNCSSVEFERINIGYRCKYCGETILAQETIDWSKYKGEREKNTKWIVKNAPPKTLLETIVMYVLICLSVFIMPLSFIVSLTDKNK